MKLVSMRGIEITIALASLIFMLEPHAKQPPLTREQRAAIKEIKAMGGRVFYVRGTSEQIVESISLHGPTFTDAQLSLLEPFRGYDLYAFGLVGARLSDKGAS